MQDAMQRIMVALRRSSGRRVALLLATLVLVLGSLGALLTLPLLAKAVQASTAAVTGGAGATLPYVEMEAHQATTNGSILGPDFSLGSLASDAVDRQAVLLTSGQYVQFTLTQPANALNLRYSIPDSASGGGISATLSIYINGVKQSQELQLTSKYSWLYGQPNFSNCNANDWSDTPGGTPHHQFDEVHVLLPQMSAGTTVKLQVDPDNTAPWYAIDVADFEQVPAPLTQPAGSISVTDPPYNADPTGKVDATSAIQQAVNDASAQGKTVWLPKGTFLVTSHILVNNVTMTGAGPWYTVLTGAPVGSNGTGVGVYGYDAYDGQTSSNVTLSNFAIEGQITNRIDCLQDNGIGGSLNNSTISNIWIEHTKVGMWFDGPFSGLKITGCRIDSVLADGINFHRNVTNSSVTQTIIRGTGDDGLAMWSATDNVPATGDSNNTFDHDTVQSPYLANGIAIYGGNGNSVTNDLVTGSQYRGGGIMIDYEDFGNATAPFAGTTTVSNDTIRQTAGIGDQGIQQFGALMFWADSGAMNATFTVSNVEIDNSQYMAISFDGGNPISTINMNGVNISGAEFAFSNKVSQVTGSASNVTASGLTVASIQSCESSGSWNITLGSGNSGWSPSSQVCGFPTGTPTPTPSPTAPLPTPTPSPTPTPQPAPTGTLVLAINAGGSAAGNFVADTDYDQGNQYSDTSTTINTSRVAEAIPQAVWQSCRWNSSFTYTIGGLQAGSSYTVALDWAELTWTAAGQRLFNVAINGTTVLSRFDVYATAGYKTALQKQFTVTANSSGQIVIAFTQGGADNPFISGIEIWQPSGGTATPTPTVTVTPTSTATPTPTPAPSGTLVLAINAGGGAAGNFVADTDYNQGNQYSDTSTAINTSGVSNPAPQAVWQSCRWNSSFTYTIPGLTAGTVYVVKLDWAELTFQAAGQRVFNVTINGSPALINFDVYATAGYKTAVQRQFNVAANSSGQIVIAFTQGTAKADNPFINGIEIWKPTSTPTPPPAGTLITAINAGGSTAGNFVADTGYNQGNQYSDTSTAINTSGVSNPAPQAVWQSCRWNSSFSYTITGLFAGARYTVKLDWAELTFQAAGQRVFNVAINGQTVLSNFDVYATAGYKTALQRQFTVQANSSGQIVISFTQGSADNPFINGIEVYQA
ncbi:malectin domain-containing carbohydrate-binding protein [Thermogemmatispora aurantia]|uniref:malectin domain-containing carbohydrate-binding protein n=1 Tax=Thermogemmatispora aurantia TaxID=2045279 RepID=UPI0014781690|nr:malectin domain-containing carbohydrate-binding protein [Thermogemmatispora aurantia]